MVQYIISSIQGLMETARQVYGVDPIIFVAIYLVCAPFWYFSLFRTLRAVATKRSNDLVLWGTIFLGTTVAPFVYVMIFGQNLPWWVYAIIAVLVGEALWTLAKKMRNPSEQGPAG